MADTVTVFVGMTERSFLKKGIHEIFNKYMDDKTVAVKAEEIFLHPKLQTKQV